MLQMPTTKIFFKLTEWAKQYGGIYSLKVGPSTIIVLSDRHAVKELLDKKSSISSDRPTSVLRQELLTGGDHLLWMDATPEWRLLRKLIHADLTEGKCKQLHAPLQHAESVQMLHDMLQTPSDWRRHIERFTNSIVLCIVYGIRSPSIHGKYLQRFEKLLGNWAAINAFGATPPVDVIPALKWVPERFLGNWISRATVVHDEMRALYDGLHELVLRRRERTGPMNSVIDRLLDQQGTTSLTRHQISNLAGVTMKGGSDTSAAVLASFVLAMILHPAIRKKAQAEIDAVIPEDRLPDDTDYDRLPYIMSIIKETQRWRPIVGVGVPHQLSEDLWVEGKMLPKGSMLLLNVWGLHHDQSMYANPAEFDPDRYRGWISFSAEYANSADPGKRDHFAYGNGRRLCPGIHLAERNLFHVVSKMLWAFDIEMAVDTKTGQPIVPDSSVETGFREGLTLSAKDFPITLNVRSEARRNAIDEAFLAACRDVFAKYDDTDLSTV
ncbi:hypothetical protein BAUCODRAFT_120072 [Baudoinia panamericana UAMH 10762]|uniref:Cytochrome P450 n=1 Tax=Baudoinia panamericana (strain UAMH 10762) TaxID=717646 RepID=M2MPT3_BAUPA|nr:uncharacterized protein BAUCODRAFT_120072 [Baudoinia panamericana UAMH 10762]EMC98771.1 hypothetical protein BAUCODRAFT_120072 [Baudoinia panamericana UAMH 10762]